MTAHANDPGAAREVYILGAGFSRALSQHFPLTDELGNLCLKVGGLAEDAGVPGGKFSHGSFETWLSRMAEPQPYQTEAQNLTNKALFLRFTDAMADILNQATVRALADGWPDWLPMLLRLSHYSHNALVTFNYDTLVECGIASHAVFDWRGITPSVPYEAVLGNIPSPPYQPGVRYGPGTADTFRLYKMHGSLNWYHVVGDVTGMSMALGPLPGFFGAPQLPNRQALKQLLPGRVPFIVPPASSKSSFFANPITRQLWQDAHDAVQAAERVTFLGYSLPAGDQTFAGLLANAWTSHSGEVTVADFKPGPVIQRIIGLGTENVLSEPFGGLCAIEDLVLARVMEAAGQLREGLALSAAQGADHAIAVSFDIDRTAAVVGAHLENDGGALVLRCEELQSWPQASGARHADEQAKQPVLTLTDLYRAGLDRAANIQVQYETVNYPLIHGDLVVAATGAANPWLILTTAASLRRGVVLT